MPSDVNRMKAILQDHPGVEKHLGVRELLTIFSELYGSVGLGIPNSRAKDMAEEQIRQWLTEPPHINGEDRWPSTVGDCIVVLRLHQEQRALCAMAAGAVRAELRAEYKGLLAAVREASDRRDGDRGDQAWNAVARFEKKYKGHYPDVLV